MRAKNRNSNGIPVEEQSAETSEAPSADGEPRADLVALFRLLSQQPPKDHDFRACPICKRHGITKI